MPDEPIAQDETLTLSLPAGPKPWAELFPDGVRRDWLLIKGIRGTGLLEVYVNQTRQWAGGLPFEADPHSALADPAAVFPPAKGGPRAIPILRGDRVEFRGQGSLSLVLTSYRQPEPPQAS